MNSTEIEIELYQQTSDDGYPYFDIYVNGVKFIAVPNDNKTDNKHPDFIGVRERDPVRHLFGTLNEIWVKEHKK